ncbi:thermonuclease family protein [Brucella rhizosphaerae]|uniref:thermonuclease family protein n=1 Tax=Brucella rhizosphaerae TaxID=571254 RepID=UPI00046778B3|nr:thermonuclease family protein [Brucella rhizosphaerae]
MIELVLAAMISTTAPQAVDGDTFDIGNERVRIANIDAPETKSAKCDAERRLGEVAKRRLQELLSSPGFEMERGDPKSGRMKDRYGRTLATAHVDGIDVGSILINEGIARPWRGKREPWCEKRLKIRNR